MGEYEGDTVTLAVIVAENEGVTEAVEEKVGL